MRFFLLRFARMAVLCAVPAAVAGCACDCKDLTPPEFPMRASAVPNDPNSGNDSIVLTDVRDIAGRAAHPRFYLGATVQNASISGAPIININGTDYPMNQLGTGRTWYLDAPDECTTSQYNYFYKARCKRGLYGTHTVRVPAADSHVVENPYSGKLVAWYGRPEVNTTYTVGVAYQGDGLPYGAPLANPMAVYRGADSLELVFTLKSIRGAPITIQHVQITGSGAGYDPSQYSFVGAVPVNTDPTTYVTLSCGDTYELHIRWNLAAGQDPKSAIIQVSGDSSFGLGLQWIIRGSRNAT